MSDHRTGTELPCVGCSYHGDSFDRAVAHLPDRDVSFVAVSRGPLDKLLAYKQRIGWTFPWVSAEGTDFNLDVSVFTEEGRRDGSGFNFGTAKNAGAFAASSCTGSAPSRSRTASSTTRTRPMTAAPTCSTSIGSCSTAHRGAGAATSTAGRGGATSTSTRARLCRDPRRERADLSPHALAARPDLARRMAHEVGGERCQDEVGEQRRIVVGAQLAEQDRHVLVPRGVGAGLVQLASLWVDRQGLLRLPKRPVAPARLAGVAVLLAGVALVQLS
jgi:hypothetical protein